MRNIWVICQKELNSYFASPVAYLLLTMFALIFGFFFWNSVGYFNMMGLESQMRGQAFPMSVNEYVIRPLLSNVSVIGQLAGPKDLVISDSAVHNSAVMGSVLSGAARRSFAHR